MDSVIRSSNNRDLEETFRNNTIVLMFSTKKQKNKKTEKTNKQTNKQKNGPCQYLGKLRTYPSPNTTLSLTFHQLTTVGLWEE